MPLWEELRKSPPELKSSNELIPWRPPQKIMSTLNSNSSGPDSNNQRRENPQPATNFFNSRLLLQRSGWTTRLISNLNDLFNMRHFKVARAIPSGRDGWVKNENFSRSQIVSFAVHGGLTMLLLLSLTGKLPITDSVKPLSGPIFAPDQGFFRTLVRKPTTDPNHGGGGGGDRNPIPASVGNLPRFSSAIQIVPPSLQSNPNAEGQVPPTLLGEVQPRIAVKDLDIWGDPKAQALTNSNGPGKNGGMGTGDKGGVGPGNGPGYGPGRDGGSGGEVYSITEGSGISYPTCAYCPKPEYSDEARLKRYQGSVMLNVVVLPNGKAGRIEVVETPGMGLDEKAIEAVRTWSFKPAIGPSGKPVAVIVPVEVAFQMF